MKKRIHFKIKLVIGIFILVVWACNNNSEKHIDTNDSVLDLLMSRNWNLVPDSDLSDSSTANYQVLHFKNNYSYFSGEHTGRLSVTNDTLFLKDSVLIKTSDNASLKKVERIYLVGELLKISADSLILRKTGGEERLKIKNRTLRFYNDSLDYDSNLILNKLVYSTSSCYGNCPAMAIEFDNCGNYKFFGGDYSELKGNYRGTISNQYLIEIQEDLRFASIGSLPQKFAEQTDAAECELIVHYNDSLKVKFKGCAEYFPPRLKNVVLVAHNSYKNAVLERTSEELIFETQIHIPKKFPPPPKLN